MDYFNTLSLYFGDHLYWVRYTAPTWAFKLDRIRTISTWVGTWIPELDHLTLSNNDYFEYSSVVTVGNEAYISLGNVIEYLKSRWNYCTLCWFSARRDCGYGRTPTGDYDIHRRWENA